MKTCPHCHALNREEARFCSACGARLEPPAAEPTSPTVEALAADAQATPLAEPAASLLATGEEIATEGQLEPGSESAVSPSPAAPAASVLALVCPSCGCTIRYCPHCGAPLETHQV